MESAFGVEHGEEIAKFGMPKGLLQPVKNVLGRVGSSAGQATSKVGQKAKPYTANTRAGVKSIGIPTRGPTPGTRATSGARGAASGAKQSAGGGLRRAGAWMQANPVKTGAGVVGASGAGGYAASRRKQ